MGKPIEDRYIPEPNTGCWLWIGAIKNNGYSSFTRNGIKAHGHRAMYELARGPIPAGLQLDHLCRVRSCVNPRHLEAVTQRINIFRGMAPTAIVNRTGRCLKGHELTEGNVIRESTGWKKCRQRAAARRKARAAKAATS